MWIGTNQPNEINKRHQMGVKTEKEEEKETVEKETKNK